MKNKETSYFFTAPGRTEISGNHTDHQHGCVLAAAVNLSTRAHVTRNGTDLIRVQSKGYPPCQISIRDLNRRPEETNTSAALIRGIAARFESLGATLCGFDADCSSTVLPGSGLSSSAAFEVLMATVMNRLWFDGRCSPIELAQIGQWAENVYFGKPCGLMDQMASAVGGIIGIDFEDPSKPVVERVDFDFAACGHALCIIDSGSSHADLTGEYAAIPQEMRSVAALFGKEVLREVDEAGFYQKLSAVRSACGDRAALRAMHFYEENKRVRMQVWALTQGDFGTFLGCVAASGKSSWMLLQDVIPSGYKTHQELALALALAEKLLGGRGACRVHGGGFAGTIQAFVPSDMLDSFKHEIEKVLGAGSCHVLSICAKGAHLAEEGE